MTSPRRTLTPVTITARYPSLRSGRLENWAAKSDDGLWKYDRVEDVGTPWEVTYLPTGEEFLSPSLPKARASTADGSALAYIEARRKEVA